MPETRSGPISRREFAVLVALLVLAVIARAIGLGGGLWIDEIIALVRSYREPLLMQFTVFQGDFHHTLYSVLARISLVLFGDSAWAIRLPALLFGAATIPLAYVLGREVMGERDAWLTAGLLTVFTPHVWFSQNARGYSMLAFWSTLATLYLVRYLRSQEKRRPAWGYAVVAALGVFTHLTMTFLVVGHATVCFVEAFRAKWKWPRIAATGLTFALAAGFTLILYAPMLTQVLDFFLNRPSGFVGVSTPLWALFESIRVIQQGLGAGTLVGVLGAAALFGLGVLSYARRAPLVLALFLVPGMVTVIGAAIARGTMYPRFFFFMVVFLVLILIRGTLVFGDWLGDRMMSRRPISRSLGPAIVGLMMVASVAGLVGYTYRYPKQDYKGAIAFVESRAGEADTIGTTGAGAWPLLEFHERPYQHIETVADLERSRSSGGRMWMVFTFPRYIENEAPEIMTAIDDECVHEAVFPGTIGGGDLIVCSFPPISSDG